MVEATQFKLSLESEAAIVAFALRGQQLLTNNWSLRPYLELSDRYYMRENDFTEAELRARAANRVGDSGKIQNVTVPIVMPQVEAAATYLTNVFLSGYPIFGVSSDPSSANAALQMETIVAENSITAGWKRQLMMFFRDGLKYNLHAVECEWQQKKVFSVQTNVGASPNSAALKETLWNGNVLTRMDLYNTFFDPRVHPSEIHSEGEYAGYTNILARIRFKKLCNDLYGTVDKGTIIRALESSPVPEVITTTTAPFGYYVPLINPDPLMYRNNLQTFDWMAWAQETPNTKSDLNYGNIYHVLKLYARILPADFGIRAPAPNTPQVWKFIIINGQVVLYAERQPNAHDWIPIFFGQPIEDGLDYQTKSFAANVRDMQDIASAMWNGYMASKRRLVGDRVIYDPSRIAKKDINSTNPAAKIPVRPSAYGKAVQEAVYQFPFRDEATNSLIQTANLVTAFADKINGQNPATQGQFVKGNKTQHEYDDVMGHGNGNNQKMAIATEEQVFQPLKTCIKLNILQFQGDVVLYNANVKQQVPVKSQDLREAAVHFLVSDGLLPTDKLIGEDTLQTALQVMGTSPAIGAAYNIGPLFSYVMKTQNLDLSPFEKSLAQQQYEQQMQAWQQAAEMAAKAGTDFSTPMPQPSPQLQQEMQQRQANGGALPSPTGSALEATTGKSAGQPGVNTSNQSQVPVPPAASTNGTGARQ